MTAKENTKSEQFVLFFLCHSPPSMDLEKELQMMLPFHSFQHSVHKWISPSNALQEFAHYQMTGLALQ